MIDAFDVARCINAVLAVALLVGLGIGRWRNRAQHTHPLGIAVLAFAVATLYGSVEAVTQDAPPGGRPLLTFAAVAVANVCVYIPLFHRPRKDTP
ncbi:hypothetical protein B0I12_002570 [Microbacterium hydrothermale]|uniref:hypothetical protein n=1 Tax=Microbacterium hydrothermale TaxID=857427 RepID=UPI002226EC56|nr:hypothetical protein [Microbacterium hydrothermale]MCW2165415.1 hypothetical protein [Microbacterium hydrothermale]